MNSDNERTVLIVDDEESLGELYSQYLADQYETRVATTSGEALVELTEEIDLVLLDRRLPGMSGDELLEHIQGWEVDCQVIMVTAVDPDIDIIEMPCDGYLTKPVSEDELVDAVERAFLIDHYEDLIAEYNQLSEKYEVLTSQFSSRELANKNRFDELEAQMEEMETEIADTAAQFSDSKLSDAFNRLH